MSSSLWENFIESLAAILARSFSNSETEAILTSFKLMQAKLSKISNLNLQKLELEEKLKSKYCIHKGRCTTNCLASLVRSFGISFVLKYALGFIPALLTGQLFKKPSLLYKFAGKDTVSVSLFMAFLISSYKGILCSMRRIRNKSDWINSFIAGSLSGLSILLDRNKTRRIMIALYLSTRTAHFLSRWIWRIVASNYTKEIRQLSDSSDDLRLSVEGEGSLQTQLRDIDSLKSISLLDLTAPTSGLKITGELSEYTKERFPGTEIVSDLKNPVRTFIRNTSGLILMMFSSSMLLNAYICDPKSLNPSYLSFLITHGGFLGLILGVRDLQPKSGKRYLSVMGDIMKQITDQDGNGMLLKDEKTSYFDKMPEYLDTSGLVEYQDSISKHSHDFVLCSLIHPNTSSCVTGMVDSFSNELVRALKLYAPLNAVNSVNVLVYAYNIQL